ncbi:KPN_02809 family neutral zinc metallopeptidase [Orbus mooreae]|uniref:KPN_02809 family neutral zinc metallopeptidase n=1 Tax=Orbus mooreae TaxID=3074107 RepID=UPI00370D45CA
MRWQNRKGSNNIEDRRSQSSSRFRTGVPLKGKSGLVLLIVIVVAGYYGVDLTGLLNSQVSSSQSNSYATSTVQEQEAAEFTSIILATTEDYWGQEFQKQGKRYIEPKLVIYNGATTTGCGTGQSIMGPFYCSVDRTVYLDLSFYQEMKQKLGGGGDFAQGYVIAHEIGHHVQNLLGTFAYVDRLGQGQSKAVKNKLSVKLELQADCYAGLWGHAMNNENILEVGDLEEALNTAQAIGDDRLQQQSSGTVMPDSFTHGTSAQRYQWFKQGFDSGNLASCDIFSQ